MVKYADYMVLCCFVFPLGFAVPTLLALFGGKEEREKGLCCSSLRHKGCQGGLQCWGSDGKLHYPAGGGGGKRSQKPLPAASCFSRKQMCFSLVWRSFPYGKDWAHWVAPGNLEAKTGEAREQTKPYRRAVPGRVASQRSLHGYSPTSSPLLMENRGRIAFGQLLR